jgi:hypothetical protein
MLNTKGLNDIQSVSNFANSASSLGLLGENGQDTKKLQTFLNTAASGGALVTGKIDMEAVSSTVNTLQTTGILPEKIQQPTQILTLLNSARNLGINSTNIAGKVTAVLDIAKQAGIKLGTPSKTGNTQQEQQGEPSDAGKAITWLKLHFDPYKFKEILELDITQAINEHACLYIRGTLTDTPDGKSQDYVQMTEQNTPIALHYTDASGALQCLFQGVVTSVKQQTIAQLDYLDIEARSFSYLLDIKKLSRSFQRHQEPYSYVFERINQSAREYIPNLSGDALAAQDTESSQTTEKLIIQYKETDWEFLKRMASHFNIGLAPDVTFDSAKIYFGPPPQKQEESSQDDKQESKGPEMVVSTYKIRRNTGEYAIDSDNSRKNSGLAFSENDFTYCEAQSLDILQLGQSVNFLNLTWYIKAIHTIMVKGAINSIYTLTTQQGLMQNDSYNNKLPGVSLQGLVKEVVKDQVRVHITDIDEEWDDSATWFFPYTTIYSSPDGSGWYCMPEVEDNVRVYFRNNKEDEAAAASSVNTTPSKRGSRCDPDSKIISTVHGKQVLITPGGIQIIANGGLLMTLSDDGGLTINSDKKIMLSADDDISISSQSRVEVKGKNQISLSQGGGNIEIQDNISVSGHEVKIQP